MCDVIHHNLGLCTGTSSCVDRSAVETLKMLGLTRRIIIFAAVDGLVLQPSPPRNHPPTTQQAIKIDYKGNISPLLKDRRDEATAPASLEVHGIVGIPPSRAIGFCAIMTRFRRSSEDRILLLPHLHIPP